MAEHPTKHDDVALSEAAYLKREAARAQLAMRKALSDAGASLMHGVDPRGWAHDHPFASLGAAAVAGFTAACAVVPSEEQQAIKKLKAIDRALRTRARKAADLLNDDEKDGHDDKKKGAAKGSFMAIAAAEAIRLLRPMVISSLAGFLRDRGTESANGNAAAANDTASDYSTPT